MKIDRFYAFVLYPCGLFHFCCLEMIFLSAFASPTFFWFALKSVHAAVAKAFYPFSQTFSPRQSQHPKSNARERISNLDK